MNWARLYDPAADKELSKLDKAVQRHIKKYLDEVCQLTNADHALQLAAYLPPTC
jgi:mRNA-degrading endonuclease RelE of RelBE toxin-antitoxin system